MNEVKQHNTTLRIEYCPKCRWLLRSAWMAQELLSTFEEELYGVMLCPSSESGLFRVWLNDALIWDRNTEHGFPDIRELKQRVRDMAFPEKSLGHSDRQKMN